MTEIKAALFDFDGTLAHLTVDFKHMRALVLAELEDILGPDAPALSRRELPVMEFIYEACSWAAANGQGHAIQAEIARRTEAAVSAYEVEAARASSLFPFTENLLNSLKKQGIKTAIVTRNCRAAVETIFPAHAALCDALVSRGDVRPEDLKPQPGQLLAALAAIGSPAENAVMVGDHPMDVISGRAAGCLTAGVLTGSADAEGMAGVFPDWLAEDAAGLFKELGLYA